MGWQKTLWLAVPLLGLLEIGGQIWASTRAPDVEAWKQIVTPVAELRQPGQPVVVAPYWAEPLARHVLGSATMPLEEVARPDLTAAARAVEVSLLGQRAGELGGWRELEHRRAGDFEIRLLENPARATVRFDFVSGLDPARVEVIDGGGRRCGHRRGVRGQCGGLHGHVAFPRERFACPGNAYSFVGVTVIDDESYRPRRCVWAHPSELGPLSIRYADVPLGKVIRGYGGLSWFLMRDGAGTPVELVVRVAGREIGRFVHEDTDGWSPFEFPTGAAGSVADVEFEVGSASSRNRHFCFYADSR